MSEQNLPRLSRTDHGRPAAPVRIVHLGIGNFTRAHQAWYTEHAPDAADWGIAAFTGRSPKSADELSSQDGLYTLITKHADRDEYEVISALSEVNAASNQQRLVELLSSPEVVLVTSTVTEKGYVRNSEGRLDLADAGVQADLETLRGGDAAAPLQTAPLRLAAGLKARAAAAAGAITVLPCDNLPENGDAFRTVVEDAVRELDPELLDWIGANVSWATSMVDRITPATTDSERAQVAETQGYDDITPVPTEPFSEWAIQGEFPGGRPAWDQAGATFVDDIVLYEQRKLWMLNGTHTLMAYAGPILGLETVADAIRDENVRRWVNELWDAEAKHLALPAEEIQAYREALLDRYENPNIRHLLAQIAHDGSQKVPVRIIPVLTKERAAGVIPAGPVRGLAAWVLHLRGAGAPFNDALGEKAKEAASSGDLPAAVRAVLGVVAPQLADDAELIDAVVTSAEEITALAA